MNEVPAQAVIDRLLQQIAALSLELAKTNARIEQLQIELAEAGR